MSYLQTSMNRFPFGRSTWVARMSYGLILRTRLWMIIVDTYVPQDIHQVLQQSTQVYHIAHAERNPLAFPTGVQ